MNSNIILSVFLLNTKTTRGLSVYGYLHILYYVLKVK